jgi:hypothetical protein
MKAILAIITIATLLCGCKPTAPATAPIRKWEYKVVTVDNFARYMEQAAFEEMRTNGADWEQHDRDAKSGAGDFHLDGSTQTDTMIDLNQIGADGWELVAAIPQTETLPGVDFDDGTVYNPDTGKLDPKISRFDNTRTGKIILIFKRPD